MNFSFYERAERQKLLGQLAARPGETEAQTLARVVPFWDALPPARRAWFPDFARALVQRVQAQNEAAK